MVGWQHERDANYISSPSVELRQELDLVTDAKGRAVVKFRMDRPEWGRFVVRITDPEQRPCYSAVQAYVDWPGWEGRSRREDPDQAAMLSFNTDKEKYDVGDKATLIIPSSGTGRALISLETGSRVLRAEWVDLKEKETRYSFPITADMAPNVYAQVSRDPTARDTRERPAHPALRRDPDPGGGSHNAHCADDHHGQGSEAPMCRSTWRSAKPAEKR